MLSVSHKKFVRDDLRRERKDRTPGGTSEKFSGGTHLLRRILNLKFIRKNGVRGTGGCSPDDPPMPKSVFLMNG